MKKLLSTVVATLLCLSTASYAQNIKQGTFEIDGGLGFDMSSKEMDIDGANNDIETDSTEFNVAALYYIRPNIGIGGAWMYDSSETDDGVTKEEETSYAIGPMISYNVSMDKQISIKLRGGFLKTGIEDEENKTETEGFLWVAGGVVSYFITKNVSINGSVSYSFGELEIKQSGTDTDADTSNFKSAIGISFYWK